MKIIDLEDHQRKDHLLMEIQVLRIASEGGRAVQVMRELVHPNLVNYVEMFMERNSLMIVMELMKVT